MHTPSNRLDRLDALRGLAMLWMTAFHFCFDLSYLQLWPQDFYNNPVWVWQRTAIVSLFLFCAGLGQAAAHSQHVPARRFFRRWLQIAGCALLVSVGSYLVFPQSYIYFGVLHGMAVMLLLLRYLGPVGAHAQLALAVAAMALPLLYAHIWPKLPGTWVQVLDHKAFSVVGLVSHKPQTEDYVPVLPWFGVLLLGYLWGTHTLQRPQSPWHERLMQPLQSRFSRALAWLGRSSLLYYMLHQLVLLGGLMLLAYWIA